MSEFRFWLGLTTGVLAIAGSCAFLVWVFTELWNVVFR